MSLCFYLLHVPAKSLTRAKTDGEFLEQLSESAGSDADGACPELDLANDWDKIHFVLSEERRASRDSRTPLDLFGKAIHGDKVLNEAVEFGFGPARFLGPAAVKKIATAFAALEARSWKKHVRELLKRHDVYHMPTFEELNKFPDHYLEGLNESIPAYVKDLTGFYARAAREKHGVIVIVS